MERGSLFSKLCLFIARAIDGAAFFCVMGPRVVEEFIVGARLYVYLFVRMNACERQRAKLRRDLIVSFDCVARARVAV